MYMKNIIGFKTQIDYDVNFRTLESLNKQCNLVHDCVRNLFLEHLCEVTGIARIYFL